MDEVLYGNIIAACHEVRVVHEVPVVNLCTSALRKEFPERMKHIDCARNIRCSLRERTYNVTIRFLEATPTIVHDDHVVGS